jgi:predicted nucleotidyltransferase
VLTRFRRALDTVFGERIEREMLFGSRARGEARDDSDYDIAVFLRDFKERWPEVDRLVAIETDLLYEAGAFVHALPFLVHGEAILAIDLGEKAGHGGLPRRVSCGSGSDP